MQQIKKLAISILFMPLVISAAPISAEPVSASTDSVIAENAPITTASTTATTTAPTSDQSPDQSQLPKPDSDTDQELVQVEILVFRYLNATALPEQWHLPSFVSVNNAIELVNPEFSLEQQPNNFCLLPKTQLLLAQQQNQLEKDDELQVILHIGWVQTISDNWHSKPVHIFGGDNYTIQGELTNEIDGTVQVSKNKFIQFSADFNFTEPFDNLNFDSNSDLSDYSPVPYALSYHLNQSRKMRLGELNYIDNPYFGLLVKIDSYKKTSNKS